MNRYTASLTSLGRRPNPGTQIHRCFRKSARWSLLTLQRRGEGLECKNDRAHTRLRRPDGERFWLCSDMHCSTSVGSEPVSEEGRLVEAGTSDQEPVSRCGAIVTSKRRDAKEGRKGKRKWRRPLRCHKGQRRRQRSRSIRTRMGSDDETYDCFPFDNVRRDWRRYARQRGVPVTIAVAYCTVLFVAQRISACAVDAQGIKYTRLMDAVVPVHGIQSISARLTVW